MVEEMSPEELFNQAGPDLDDEEARQKRLFGVYCSTILRRDRRLRISCLSFSLQSRHNGQHVRMETHKDKAQVDPPAVTG